jgi:site-specific DNA-methyltransferase (adenine-specific)
MGTSLSGSADGSLRRATGDAEKESGFDPNVGRWPANFLHDGSEAVLKAFAAFGEKEAPQPRIMRRGATTGTSIGGHGTYGTSDSICSPSTSQIHTPR